MYCALFSCKVHVGPQTGANARIPKKDNFHGSECWLQGMFSFPLCLRSIGLAVLENVGGVLSFPCELRASLASPNIARPILESFRLEYEYEIDYEYDFRIQTSHVPIALASPCW